MSEQFASPRLLAALEGLDVQLDSEQVHQLETLGHELVTWNERVNLTAITDPPEVEIKHVLDSLVAIPLIRARLGGTHGNLVDVGAGAGFPGLPLAIALQALDVTLLEATGKKVQFLNHAIDVLGIGNARAVHGRAEEIGHAPELRERAEFAVARAVGRVAALCELTLPFVAVGGWALLWKTRTAAVEEVKEARGALATLGGVLEEIVDVSVPRLLEGRVCVVLRKTAHTPAGYPRRPGMPQHKPLGVRSGT